MIASIIRWCATHRIAVASGALLLALWGAWAMTRTPIDAIPDISDVQVIIATEWPGRSPDLVEAQITYPLVSALVSAPRVRTVRGFTELGTSFVYIVFEDGVDMYWARSRVVEYLQGLRGRLPADAAPVMGPDATGVGWVFEYALTDESGRHTLAELRSLQDWTLRYALASVPGVAEVASIGGFVRQYQVAVDPARLAAFRLSITDVSRAIRASNSEAEGRVLELAGREYMVRARGYVTSIEDISGVAVGVTSSGTPVRVGDVATVSLGPELRRGAAELDGKGEVVGGIIVMRFGENALRVIDRVKARLREIETTLPPGVAIVPTYDRSTLIHDSIDTLTRTLIEEAIVVAIVIALFLFHLRSALVPILCLPIAVLAAFVPMYYLGVAGNIMSLGGLALAIGVLVDASIVMVENAYRRLAEAQARAAAEPGGGPLSRAARKAIVIDAAAQVGRPIFFSLGIIITSFVPVFLLEAQEGRLFRPLAFTKTFAMTMAAVLSITLVPALMTWLIRGRRLRPESEHPLARALTAVYAPLLRLTLRWRWTALLINLLIVLATIPLLFRMGSEFMPPLYEGSLLYMPTAPPGLPVGEAVRLLQAQDKVLRDTPEVARVFGTVGRATSATDNSPMGMVNTTVLLKPRAQWRAGLTLAGLQAELDTKLQTPGVPNVWTQPIRNRLDMLLTGIKTPVGVKILGPDLARIEQIGLQVERVLAALPEARSVYAERTALGYFVDIRPNRAAFARHGLLVADAQAAIRAAIGGEIIGTTYEGRERYSIEVRYQRAFRDDLPALQQMLVSTPSSAQVPLRELADITLTTGPAMVRDEEGQLAGFVYVDTVTSDLGGFVQRAQAAVRAQVTLPAGYALRWTGQYEHALRARDRLRLVVPIVLLAIFVLLYLTFHSVAEALIVMLSVVYAMTGGLWLQWWLGYPFSVAVWVGYIALYGVAVQTGVVMVVYLHEALRARADGDVWAATLAGSVQRLRPKVMTVSVVLASLAPIVWSQGAGADVMKPIAVPIIGGMVTSTIHVLFITPVIFYLMKRRRT